MREIIVSINRDMENYLERLNYELNFTKDIIQRIIVAHPNDPDIVNSETFKHYQKQGAELQTEYAVASAELEEKYIPAALKGHKYNWNIPVDSGKLIINVLCDCEIEGLEFKEV